MVVVVVAVAVMAVVIVKASPLINNHHVDTRRRRRRQRQFATTMANKAAIGNRTCRWPGASNCVLTAIYFLKAAWTARTKSCEAPGRHPELETT